ncbi:MAG: hypothetical protein AAGF97_08995 [Planctomycetota bacterium]
MRLTLTLLLAVSIGGCSQSSKTITTSRTAGDAAAKRDPLPAKIQGEAGYVFARPTRLEADGQAIDVEEPGYACPTVADVDQDGNLDLVVGQFSGGSMQFFKNEAGPGEAPQLVAAGWLQTDDERAIVPGVW